MTELEECNHRLEIEEANWMDKNAVFLNLYCAKCEKNLKDCYLIMNNSNLITGAFVGTGMFIVLTDLKPIGQILGGIVLLLGLFYAVVNDVKPEVKK
jgi:hypothetical protein